jgi:hypothetical protein
MHQKMNVLICFLYLSNKGSLRIIFIMFYLLLLFFFPFVLTIATFAPPLEKNDQKNITTTFLCHGPLTFAVKKPLFPL